MRERKGVAVKVVEKRGPNLGYSPWAGAYAWAQGSSG